MKRATEMVVERSEVDAEHEGGGKVQESDCVNRAAAEVESPPIKWGCLPRCTVHPERESHPIVKLPDAAALDEAVASSGAGEGWRGQQSSNENLPHPEPRFSWPFAHRRNGQPGARPCPVGRCCTALEKKHDFPL